MSIILPSLLCYLTKYFRISFSFRTIYSEPNIYRIYIEHRFCYLLTIVYHWLSKMTPINFQSQFFFFLFYSFYFEASCFNYAWSRIAKMLIPRSNLIDLMHRSIKNRYNDGDTAATSKKKNLMQKQKKTHSQQHQERANPQFQVAIRLSFIILHHVYPVSFVRLISNEWWDAFFLMQPAQSHSLIHGHSNVFFFLLSTITAAALLVILLLLLLLPQNKQRKHSAK